jgi:hypothetical protein
MILVGSSRVFFMVSREQFLIVCASASIVAIDVLLVGNQLFLTLNNTEDYQIVTF